MLLGCIEHMFIHWHIQGKPEERADIMSRLDAIMDAILNGIRSRQIPQELVIHIDLPAAMKFREGVQWEAADASAAPKKKKTK